MRHIGGQCHCVRYSVMCTQTNWPLTWWAWHSHCVWCACKRSIARCIEDVLSLVYLRLRVACFMYAFGRAYGLPYKMATFIATKGGIQLGLLLFVLLDVWFMDNALTCTCTHNSLTVDIYVLTITEPRPIVKLAWSPSRYGLLASLARDSSVVKLYNVQHVGKFSKVFLHILLETTV